MESKDTPTSNENNPGILVIPLETFKVMNDKQIQEIRDSQQSEEAGASYSRVDQEGAAELEALQARIAEEGGLAFASYYNDKTKKEYYIAEQGNAKAIIYTSEEKASVEKLANDKEIQKQVNECFADGGVDPEITTAQVVYLKYTVNGRSSFQKFLAFGTQYMILSGVLASQFTYILAKILQTRLDVFIAGKEKLILAEMEKQFATKLEQGGVITPTRFVDVAKGQKVGKFFWAVRWLNGGSFKAAAARWVLGFSSCMVMTVLFQYLIGELILPKYHQQIEVYNFSDQALKLRVLKQQNVLNPVEKDQIIELAPINGQKCFQDDLLGDLILTDGQRVVYFIILTAENNQLHKGFSQSIGISNQTSDNNGFDNLVFFSSVLKGERNQLSLRFNEILSFSEPDLIHDEYHNIRQPGTQVQILNKYKAKLSLNSSSKEGFYSSISRLTICDTKMFPE